MSTQEVYGRTQEIIRTHKKLGAHAENYGSTKDIRTQRRL